MICTICILLRSILWFLFGWKEKHVFNFSLYLFAFQIWNICVCCVCICVCLHFELYTLHIYLPEKFSLVMWMTFSTSSNQSHRHHHHQPHGHHCHHCQCHCHHHHCLRPFQRMELDIILYQLTGLLLFCSIPHKFSSFPYQWPCFGFKVQYTTSTLFNRDQGKYHGLVPRSELCR